MRPEHPLKAERLLHIYVLRLSEITAELVALCTGLQDINKNCRHFLSACLGRNCCKKYVVLLTLDEADNTVYWQYKTDWVKCTQCAGLKQTHKYCSNIHWWFLSLPCDGLTTHPECTPLNQWQTAGYKQYINGWIFKQQSRFLQCSNCICINFTRVHIHWTLYCGLKSRLQLKSQNWKDNRSLHFNFTATDAVRDKRKDRTANVPEGSASKCLCAKNVTPTL